MDSKINDNKMLRKKLYVKVYYSMLDWGWYDDTNTFRVFMHLLLIANRNDHDFHGKVIHRGEALASLDYLSKTLNLSVQSVRTALEHLEETGEITKRKVNGTSVIRLNNYIRYQSDNKTINKASTTEEQSFNNRATNLSQSIHNESTTLKECKSEEIEENEILRECVCNAPARTHGKHNNVVLTDDEYSSFLQRYPDIAYDVIEELSDKIATGDKRYSKGHAGHLYIFARNYTAKKQEKKSPASYDIDLALKRALQFDPTQTKRRR